MEEEEEEEEEEEMNKNMAEKMEEEEEEVEELNEQISILTSTSLKRKRVSNVCASDDVNKLLFHHDCVLCQESIYFSHTVGKVRSVHRVFFGP